MKFKFEIMWARRLEKYLGVLEPKKAAQLVLLISNYTYTLAIEFQFLQYV